MPDADLGMKVSFLTALDYNGDDTTPATGREDELGIQRWQISQTEGLKGYTFVDTAATTAAIADGTPVRFTDKYRRTVSDKNADAGRNQAAGVGIGVITIGNKGWIQNHGYHDNVLTDAGGDIADGDFIILAAADAAVDRMAAGTAPTHKVVGVAVADDDADSVEAYITLFS